MRVLVTGASGFIGLPVVRHLEQQGHTVLALSRTVTYESSVSSVKWLKADLSSTETYQNQVQDFYPEALVHLAWQGIPDFSFETSRRNLNQSLALLSYVIGLGSCRKILVSGSCFEQNRLNGVCSEAEKGTPKDDFTWAKHALHSWLEVSCAKKEIEMGWLRVFYVYGPRQRQSSLIPIILTHLKNGKLPELRTPQNANDFVYVEDVAKAFSDTVSKPTPSGIYNLGSGFSTSVLEICRQAEKIVLGSDSLTCELEEKTLESVSNVNFWADYSNAKQFLGYFPETSLSDGINKTWNWINNQ
jgi:nucleoside-diphosphate-sugar epimerase